MAREFALDVSLGSYQPDLVTHAPGVAAVIADALSRRFQLDSAHSLPVLLVDVPEFHPPTRSDEYFLTLRKPQGALHSSPAPFLSESAFRMLWCMGPCLFTRRTTGRADRVLRTRLLGRLVLSGFLCAEPVPGLVGLGVGQGSTELWVRSDP